MYICLHWRIQDFPGSAKPRGSVTYYLAYNLQKKLHENEKNGLRSWGVYTYFAPMIYSSLKRIKSHVSFFFIVCGAFNYRPQMKFAKVMFLHLPVILFTGRGVCLSACWYTHALEQTPSSPGGDTPQEQTPPTAECMLGDTGNKRAVRILLECIFVQCNVFSRVCLSVSFLTGRRGVYVASTSDGISQCGDPPPELFKFVHLGSPPRFIWIPPHILTHTSIGKRTVGLRLKDLLVLTKFKICGYMLVFAAWNGEPMMFHEL